MNAVDKNLPPVLALFAKRIEGDDSLFELARRRFQQAGLGAEMYAGTVSELEWLLRFKPSLETPVIVHLPRDLDLLDPSGSGLILNFASRFAGRVGGLVVHDQAELGSRFEDYIGAARSIASRLSRVSHGPQLYIEYAVGLDPELFSRFCSAIAGLEGISVCIDVGHLGIWQVRKAYAQSRPGQDVCAIFPTYPQLDEPLISEVDRAVGSALPAILDFIQGIGGRDKTVHFHLHDGHPMSSFSPFGMSDHLSFTAQIPIGIEYHGRRFLPTMFGPAGLERILSRAIQCIGPELVSFTLEIHPTDDQLALDDADDLFRHWRDKTNAMKMNHWLWVLARNCQLVRAACMKACQVAAGASRL
ncbi:MAG: hypothetical protein M1608_10730 [Candidatus Omnitrophica bacterium]|nr:hypothetical protein [Candidatus Omnitrophota bacterium]